MRTRTQLFMSLVLLANSLSARAQITEFIDLSGVGAVIPLLQPRGVLVDATGTVYLTGAVSNNVIKVAP